MVSRELLLHVEVGAGPDDLLGHGERLVENQLLYTEPVAAI